MALNKIILLKIVEKTENLPGIRDCLIKLLEFESGTPGWWTEKYNEIIEASCKEVIENENQ